ncbi:MAG TPA: hypothetical protein VHD88_01145 [Pyrinomonadaceae bacterium]|nr:hypothetical protein [Pyrinomonadaceae bacterium]
MLAYVFWHWPSAEVNSEAYQKALLEFHQSLSAHKPAGFLYSIVFRIRGAPWLAANVEGYEDWYIVDGSGALDVLNEAAVTYPSKQFHDRAAKRAAGGTAGLYRFRRGQIDFSQARFGLWLSKPTGTSYDDFYASLSQVTSAPAVALWGRQMVLGPTPEFFVLSPEKISLNESFNALTTGIELIWCGQ